MHQLLIEEHLERDKIGLTSLIFYFKKGEELKEREVFNKQSIINELIKSHHGDLNNYVSNGLLAAENDPEFFAHLIVWNLIKGEIRDSKIALPIINLRKLNKEDTEFAENAISSLMTLDPRSLVKAYRFNKELSKTGRIIPGKNRRMLESALKKYLEIRETNRGWWDRTVLQHKKSIKELYAVSHYKPSDYAQAVLFDKEPPKGSIFQKISSLHNMAPSEAAGFILNHKIPYQIALGSLGRKKSEYEKNPEFILALLEGMSGQQLLNSTKFLTSMGVFSSPMLSSEYNKALERAKKDKKVSTLKAGKAMEALQEDSTIDPNIIAKLSAIQETKISQKTLEGDWLVLGDCSGSMSKAIELSKDISSYITKSVKGKVYLIFFNVNPRFFEVTGKKLEEIKKETKFIIAGGGTSCGCGLKFLQDRNIIINGITMVSDGGDNRAPLFHDAYKSYIKKMDIEPTVYFFKVPGDRDVLSEYCKKFDVHLETFNMEKIDYYSLPNIIPTMKTSRYGLLDEIMNIPLLTFEKVFATK